MNGYLPLRRCLGCMRSKPKGELLRIVLEDGRPKYDADGKAEGRGSYLCRSRKCFDSMVRHNSLARAYRQKITKEDYERLERELPAPEL